MPISLTMLGNTFAEALLAALKPESTRIAALAGAEARKLAALARVHDVVPWAKVALHGRRARAEERVGLQEPSAVA